MKAKEKFMKIFKELPMGFRDELIVYVNEKNIGYGIEPMSLNVCWMEIKNNTKLGKRILKQLGFEDDKEKSK